MLSTTKNETRKRVYPARTYSSRPNQTGSNRTGFRFNRFNSNKIGSREIVKKDVNLVGEIVRFVPLGGLEEVGRNCAYFEYKDEIVIVDVGIQFPEQNTPGIDYIIPNISSLEPKKQNIRGIILTHGHYDHISALPYLIEKLGNPTIYTAAFAKAMVEKRFEEFPNLPKPNFHIVKNGDIVKISDHFEAEFFDIEHSIPDAIGVILTTPIGKLAHFGDFRLAMTKDGKPTSLEIFERIGKMKVHSIFLDSTNSLKEGFSLSERTIEENIEKLFKNAEGRLIVGMFASLITRIIEVIKIASVKFNRKIAINGRSMKENIQIAQNLGYLKMDKSFAINLEDVSKYKDDKIMILTTGAQGESNAGLMRIVNGEHRTISLKKTDTVIFSSSVVPGNERSVQALQDNIARQVDETYNSKLLDIHTSGHAHAEDLKLVIKLTDSKFIVPIHAFYFMRKHVEKLAENVNVDKNKVKLVDNGQICLLTKDGFMITDEKVTTDYVMVDGLGVGDVESVVLRDRLALANEGMVVVITSLNRQTGKILKNPDIISRGFIYLKENQELLNEIRKKIRNIIGRIPRNQPLDPDYAKSLIRDQIGQFLYNKTKRRPMILPVIIEV